MKFGSLTLLFLSNALTIQAFTTTSLPAVATRFSLLQGSSIIRQRQQAHDDGLTWNNNHPLLFATTTRPQDEEQQQKENVDNNVESTTTTKSYLDDGFVFGLQGSGLTRPKGGVANLVVDGDSLETEPYQIALVTGTFAGHFYFIFNAMQTLMQQYQPFLDNNDSTTMTMTAMAMTLFQTLFIITTSWLTADAGTGIFHWSVDNYGNGKTPVFGTMIAAFQGHHSAPWTITQRGFCNNVYKLCLPMGVAPLTLLTVILGTSFLNPSLIIFMTSFCGWVILSQECHKYSHLTKSNCPLWIDTLQRAGLVIDRNSHNLHHVEPYDGNYCILSGQCNQIMDEIGLFRRLEHFIYNINGVESNAWKLDPQLRERTLNGQYGLPNKMKKKNGNNKE